MKNTKILLMVTAISLMLFMGGSKAMAWFEGYGSIVPSSDVTQAYESYRADPDLVSYFSGPSDERPDAIIGVNKAYTLDSSLWQKVTVTTSAGFKNLARTWVGWIAGRELSSGAPTSALSFRTSTSCRC